MAQSPEQLQSEAMEIMELIEDVVEYHCDEKYISGEKMWVMINALSTYKLNEFRRFSDACGILKGAKNTSTPLIYWDQTQKAHERI